MLAGGLVEAVRAGCVLPTAGAVEYEGGGLRIPRRVFAIPTMMRNVSLSRLVSPQISP